MAKVDGNDLVILYGNDLVSENLIKYIRNENHNNITTKFTTKRPLAETVPILFAFAVDILIVHWIAENWISVSGWSATKTKKKEKKEKIYKHNSNQSNIG